MNLPTELQSHVVDQSKCKQVKISKSTAKAIVRAINIHMNALTEDSTLVGCRSSQTSDNKESKKEECDITFGLFERHELRLGKHLGSGGFSEVHEITAFDPKDAREDYQRDQIDARRFYQTDPTKNGKPKYAIKHLKQQTTAKKSEFAMAAADLVVEARFLSHLDHENILKIRGWSTTGVESYLSGEHDGYFLILDRLHETLDKQIRGWSEERKLPAWEAFGLGVCNLAIENTTSQLISCTRIASQIALAIEYLHSKNIVFRDLKPDNIGFDEHGTVKLFDFGLARELPEVAENTNDVYEMSGKMGTIRYMAPEVALSKHYNQKVDTYSWAMVFWSCLALQKPYIDYSRPAHLDLCCKRGMRPSLVGLPGDIQMLLTRSWDQQIRTRLTMSEVCGYLNLVEKRLYEALESKPIKCKRSVASRFLPSFVKRRVKNLTRSTSKTAKTYVSKAA